jgi:hypothetical protein
MWHDVFIIHCHGAELWLIASSINHIRLPSHSADRWIHYSSRAHSNTMQTAQEETEGFDPTKWGYFCLLLDSRVVLISTTEESGGSLSGWYQCFLVLDTENSIHNDNTWYISRAFKRLRAAYPVSDQSIEVYGLWGTKSCEESHEKTQITRTVEMLSAAWMCDAPLTKFWPRCFKVPP